MFTETFTLQGGYYLLSNWVSVVTIVGSSISFYMLFAYILFYVKNLFKPINGICPGNGTLFNSIRIKTMTYFFI